MFNESLRAFLKPVLAYLDDETVSEVMINGPQDVWIERKGKLIKTEARFSEEGLLGAARNMAQFVNRPLSEERPRLDARLPDGSRIHAVLAPIARQGTTICIRKFFRDQLGVDALFKLGSLTPQMGRLLEAIILTRLNAIISGGTGSGKTTLLNLLSSLIPNEERILTIEDSAELRLNQEHLVAFESRPPDKHGKGEVNMGDLLQSALRLRPDRIIVGEVLGGECFHLLQAMNTGHGGSLSTVHANTPADTLRRLESLCLMSQVELPLVAVRAQVASSIQVMICTERLLDGSRKVTHISEVLPLSDRGEYRIQDLWVYTPLARDPAGNTLGYHAPTGVIPTFAARARAEGLGELEERFFDPATYGLPPPPLRNLGEDYSPRWASSLKHRERNQPDPDSYREQLRALEQKLRGEARGERPPPRSRPPEEPRPPAPRPAPRLRLRPLPSPLSSEEVTPGPSANPFEPDTGTLQVPEPARAEPKVEISRDLLAEAREYQETEARPLPRPRPSPKAPPPPVGPARRPEPPAEEETRIKPAPEKFRR